MNLKTDQTRWKVFLDESYAIETETGKTSDQWRYYELRGRHGMIYPFSAAQLHLYCDSNTISNRISKEKGWRVMKQGDEETVFEISDKDLDMAASLIYCRKKRKGKPGAGLALRKYWYKKKNTCENTSPAV